MLLLDELEDEEVVRELREVVLSFPYLLLPQKVSRRRSGVSKRLEVQKVY